MIVYRPVANAADLQLHPKLKPLPFQLMGPFTHTRDGKILAIDSKATFISDDGGLTWSDPRPLFDADRKITVSNYREELSLAFSDDEGESWSEPVVVARHKGKWLSYPYAFEVEPGCIWLTTMQGNVGAEFQESDFCR